MQLVNGAPVAHPQPVAVTALQLRDVAVRGVRVSSNLFDLCHNPLLQIHREPGKRFSEGFCGDDLVHKDIVTLSNIVGQGEFVTERNILAKGRGNGLQPFVSFLSHRMRRPEFNGWGM